jgi:ABC-type uncharacterized transport system permease subunit
VALRSLPVLAVLTSGLVGLALVLALLVAPEDADQGISQRIFYIHVPIALTAYFCFGLGAWKALRLLWRGEERYDLESYVAIHQGTIFGAVLIPVSFLAIRLANDFIHPTVFTRDGPQMSGLMFATFCVSWAAMTSLAYVLYRVELLGKRIDIDLRELREALQ